MGQEREEGSFEFRFRHLVLGVLSFICLVGHAAIAAGRHADAALEALLPQSLGGLALTIESQAGADLSTKSGPFDRFLSKLGKSRADFTIASAYSQGELRAAVGAWRVDGTASRTS